MLNKRFKYFCCTIKVGMKLFRRQGLQLKGYLCQFAFASEIKYHFHIFFALFFFYSFFFKSSSRMLCFSFKKKLCKIYLILSVYILQTKISLTLQLYSVNVLGKACTCGTPCVLNSPAENLRVFLQPSSSNTCFDPLDILQDSTPSSKTLL